MYDDRVAPVLGFLRWLPVRFESYWLPLKPIAVWLHSASRTLPSQCGYFLSYSLALQVCPISMKTGKPDSGDWANPPCINYKLSFWFTALSFLRMCCVCARVVGDACGWRRMYTVLMVTGGWSDVLRVHWAQLTDKTHWTRQHGIREATGKFALEAHIPRTRTVVLHSALPGPIWHFSRTEWIYYSSAMRHTTQMRSNY